MIVLSIGMPRAGSGWFFNLTNDLMVAGGFQDARQIRGRYHLGKVLTEVNCNIGAFTFPRLSAVLVPAILGNSFTVKAHAGPTGYAKFLVRRGTLIPTYIYRDPRDALLSAWEYGQRGIEAGRSNAFSFIRDFETALNFILDYLRIWEMWMDTDGVLHCRYEDLLNNYYYEVGRLVDFIGLNPEKTEIQKVIENNKPGADGTDRKGMHFRKGVVGRFRQKLTGEQISQLNQTLAPYLERMGYEI
jgi:hypothetical protein